MKNLLNKIVERVLYIDNYKSSFFAYLFKNKYGNIINPLNKMNTLVLFLMKFEIQ